MTIVKALEKGGSLKVGILTVTQEVAGSSPVAPATFNSINSLPVASFY